MSRCLALTTLLFGVLLFSSPVCFADEKTEAKTEAKTAEKTGEKTDEDDGGPDQPTTLVLSSQTTQLWFAVGNTILFVCAVLVLFMQAGFAMVESGFNSQKNTVNILFKNVMDLCIGALLFWAVGYNIMYPAEEAAKESPYFVMPNSVGVSPELDEKDFKASSLSPQVAFLFQVAFAATAATIVSGAVAGRMKFGSYLIYSAVLTGLVYPVSGMWKWGLGWLDQAGFWDFAGSLVVHAVGGFAGLAGAIVLGPRIGRFKSDGTPQPIPGHNLTIAALGVFILWIGWYGFNPGSQLDFSSASKIHATMLIAVNTTLAAAAGGIAATIVGWVMFKKPDLSLALNGVLAGLVGITANCDCVTNPEAIIIGLVAGGLVVGGSMLLDKLRIDDPVGAWPVHGLCGIWGGIATGIFGQGKNLGAQIKGCLAISLWAFVTMFALFYALKAIGILRVSPEDEVRGLDLSEHNMHAYGPDPG